MPRKTERVDVFRSSLSFGQREEWLVDFIAGLQTALRQVPKPLRNKAVISFGSEFEDSDIEILIYYDRPKTPAELKAEREKERQDRAERQHYIRERELAQLAAL